MKHFNLFEAMDQLEKDFGDDAVLVVSQKELIYRIEIRYYGMKKPYLAYHSEIKDHLTEHRMGLVFGNLIRNIKVQKALEENK